MTTICWRVNLNNPDYIHYHNTERGKPTYDDKLLFEMLILEGAQAGLSRETVLKKRENYRKLFHNYDLKKIIAMTDDELDRLLLNPDLIRNKLKIQSVRQNAQVFLQIQSEFGSFANYLRKRTDWKVINNDVPHYKAAPSSSPLSDAISKDLKKRWMKFVGSTIIYAYLQAIGIINDHENHCPYK